jgi:hypothetical protein
MPKLPNHPAVMRTCLLLIGVYAHWLREHPAFIGPAMKLVVEGCEYVKSGE